MKGNLKQLGASLLAVTFIAGSLAACKRPPKNARKAKRTMKASIAEFDPSADVHLDLSKYGTERVDEYLVQEALNRSFGSLDACVVSTKQRLNLGDDAVIDGDVDFAIKLNPDSKTPLAVNADISNKKFSKDKKFKDCMRDAVAGVGFPTYKGPPQVVEFSTQIDPGYMEEDDNTW